MCLHSSVVGVLNSVSVMSLILRNLNRSSKRVRKCGTARCIVYWVTNSDDPQYHMLGNTVSLPLSHESVKIQTGAKV